MMPLIAHDTGSLLPRVLILESDPEIAMRLVSAMASSRVQEDVIGGAVPRQLLAG